LNYEKPEDIFNEHRETTRGRDLDITGLSYALLDERGPQQWPFPENAREGKKRLYEDGVFPTASGRARFVATPYRGVAEEVDARLPAAPHHRAAARSVARDEPDRDESLACSRTSRSRA